MSGLRKYVTTEQETVTVPVKKERAVLETEPITGRNRDQATSGPAISEEEHEVVLNEERPVVGKTAEPVERVRLGTETVTDEETVTEEVRKEHIEADGDVDDRRGSRVSTSADQPQRRARLSATCATLITTACPTGTPSWPARRRSTAASSGARPSSAGSPPPEPPSS